MKVSKVGFITNNTAE